MQLNTLKKIQDQIGLLNGKIHHIGENLFVASYPSEDGTRILIQKALMSPDSVITISPVFYGRDDDLVCCKRMVNMVDDWQMAIGNKRTYSELSGYTQRNQIEMEFIGTCIPFNGNMVDMALYETVNGMTTADAVREVVAEMEFKVLTADSMY